MYLDYRQFPQQQPGFFPPSQFPQFPQFPFPPSPDRRLEQRVDRLERQVQELNRRVRRLEQRVGF